MEPDDDKTRTHVVLTKGTMVSHYRIVEKIGAGGMGEVYLAEDTKLKRQVALKFLPSHLCQDEDCRARFKREAQAVAKLSHPNVVTIYEVSESQGRPFFAMEHVEGRSLREFSSDEDPSIERILELGIQICEGLNDAHENGITHRDIKPSNILIDSHGRAKIVDFGLASVVGTDQITKTGSTLGTIGYMSPEQIQGEGVDQRSDLFSFGVVLYELIAKQNPFKRDSEAATIQAILNTSPTTVARLREGLPFELPLIIEKLLAKSRNNRYQQGREVLVDLRALFSAERLALQESISGIAWAKRWMLKGAISWVFGLAAVVIIVVIASKFLTQKDHLVATQKRLTFHNNAFWGTLSGNKQYVAYTVLEDTVWSIFIRDLDMGEARRVFNGNLISDLNWSPDGRELLFAGTTDSVSGIFLLPVLGGQTRVYPHAVIGYPNATWSPDGSRFAVSGLSDEPRGITIFEKKSGDTTVIEVAGSFERIRNVDWSPEGNLFIFNAMSPNGLWVCNTDGSGARKLADGVIIPPSWNSTGTAVYYLVWTSNEQNLMKLDVNPSTGIPKDNARIILPGIRWASAAEISVSEDGRSLVCTKENRWTDIWMVTLRGDTNSIPSEPRKMTDMATRNTWPAFSPDGRWLAYQALLPSGEGHLYVVSTDGAERKRLTYDNWLNWTPAWSPDGSRLAFGTAYKPGDDYRVAVIDRTGGIARVFDSSSINQTSLTVRWFPGEKILYQRRGGQVRLLDPISGEEGPLPAVAGGVPVHSAMYSPTGTEVAAWLDPTPEYSFDDPRDSAGIWIIDTRNETATLASRVSGALIDWSTDGNSLYLLKRKLICRLDLPSGSLDTLVTLDYNIMGAHVAITNDGSKIACVDWNTITDIWLVEDFDPDVK